MYHNMRFVGLFALLLTSICFALAADFPWKDAAVGTPPPGGQHTWNKGVLTLTGAGAGLNIKGTDQYQYVYVSRPAGDFEVVVRLTEISSDGEVTAGIMVRADDTPTGPMAACYFSTKNHAINWISRIPGSTEQAKPRVFSAGIQLANPQPVLEVPVADPDKPVEVAAAAKPLAPRLPLWMRLVRMGNNFAVYKSRDGKLWSMISNVSGGPIALEGAFSVGLFITRPGDTPAKASFDSIQIGKANMRYKTSWVGNTFGCRNDDNHVSNALSAMWVAPDGTCYTSSYWDEAGQPVTSYRDGKVLRGLPIGTPQTAEGGITGDDTHIYVASVDRVTELTPAAIDFAPRPIIFSVNLHDAKLGRSVISGLATFNKELFVADSRDNLIRVATLAPVITYHTATAANDGIAIAPAPIAVPANDPRFAPAEIYLTQRVGEGFRYTLPGCTPAALYTVRCHFAEYVKRAANADPRFFLRSVDNEVINVTELAGGILKAAVKDIPGYKADANGNVIVNSGAYGGPGLCGLEVLDAVGKRIIAINCGGPELGDFSGESAELVKRAIPFERPGPMTVDKRGNLWIIQCGNDFPMGNLLSAKYQASIKCYQPDGTFTGREISDVVNPRGLGYDAANDQLLVAENGADLNVRFYTGLATKPVLAKTFGEKGGIFSGAHPGQVYDAAAGGYARFAGLTGVGVDAKGNLYVGGGFQGSDLRMFTPDGKFGWMLNSLMFCNTYDVDPASDGADIYGTYNHLKLDLSKTAPGSEQQYVGYNWDLNNYAEPVRAGGSQSIVRRLGADKQLVMFTSGQGNIGDIHIFRYQGEMAIPAGGTRENGSILWTDTNGNGLMEDAEKTKMAPAISWLTSLVIDSKGDIWATMTSTGGSFMRHFFFKGINEKGVPLYSALKEDGYVDIPYPEEGGKMNGWGMASRMDYDAERDILVAYYPAVRRLGENDKTPAQYYLACYDNWSKGNQTPRWKIKAYDPEVNPDYFMYETNLFPYRGYEGLQIAGDYLFFAYLFGEIHAFNLKTGELSEILAFGPEVMGNSAWEDAAMGLRAYQRKNGEYLIFTENSGWGGKNNFIRWKP